jgi:hypothetical protein
VSLLKHLHVLDSLLLLFGLRVALQFGNDPGYLRIAQKNRLERPDVPGHIVLAHHIIGNLGLDFGISRKHDHIPKEAFRQIQLLCKNINMPPILPDRILKGMFLRIIKPSAPYG